MATKLVDLLENPLVKKNDFIWRQNNWTEFPKNNYFGLNGETIKADISNPIYKNSYYKKLGGTLLNNNLNPFFAGRKILYRLMNNVDNVYKMSDGSIVMEYDDNSFMDIINKFEKNDTLAWVERKIVVRLQGGKIISGYETSDTGKKGNLKYANDGLSSKGHSVASYLEGVIAYVLTEECTSDPSEFKNEFYELKTLINSKPYANASDNELSNISTLFTRVENDLFITAGMAKGFKDGEAIAFEPYILDQAKKEGTQIFGKKETKTSKPKAKMTVAKTIKSLVDKGTYFINHTLATGEEELIPNDYDGFVVSEDVEDTLMIIKNRHDKGLASNIMFTGEAGTGKTTAAQMLARALGLPYYFITCCANTESYDLQVRNAVKADGSGVQLVESQVLKAFRDGGIIEIQEFNMVRKQSVLTYLNSALDGIGKMESQDGKVINRHKDCVFVFTMNVGYEGTNPINQALRSRMNYCVNFELPEKDELERNIVKETGLSASVASKLVRVFDDLRKALRNNGEENGICSRRELNNWAEASKIFIDAGLPEDKAIHKAAVKTIVAAASDDEDLKSELLTIVGTVFPAK